MLVRPQAVLKQSLLPLPACKLDRRTVLVGFCSSLMAHGPAKAAAAPATGTVRLDNGVEIPSVGLGVFLTRKGGQTQQAVREALAAGYRHIDTAQLYGNEADVGQQAAFSF